jgi:DNA-binding NtrC family response regulator
VRGGGEIAHGGLRALVVDPDRGLREGLRPLLEEQGYCLAQADTLEHARSLLAADGFDVLLVEPDLPDGDGLTLLEVRACAFETVVITARASIASAVAALRAGAIDYLTKPLDRARLGALLGRVARTRAVRGPLPAPGGGRREPGGFGTLVGSSPPMQEVYRRIGKVAPTNASVLVVGESGTGKELVAQTIHRASRRAASRFVAVNCGALSASLAESELFGHEKGSFTGAESRRAGYFEQASGGTLFLDEITEMPAELQVKLLRALEAGAVRRVGGSEPVAVDVRLIAASNLDPERAVAEGRLRRDVLYRLNVFPISVPPLRQRGADVELLARSFLERVNQRDGDAKRFSAQTIDCLRSYAWPGNVRELRNAVERAAIVADRVIAPADLPRELREHSGAPAVSPDGGYGDGADAFTVEVGCSLAGLEKRLILATLRSCAGDKRRAAEQLGISVRTLYQRLSVYRAGGPS